MARKHRPKLEKVLRKLGHAVKQDCCLTAALNRARMLRFREVAHYDR
jgi:hypothetical protein